MHFVRYGKSINGVDSIVNMRDDTEHARVRKIFTPAFSDRSLTAQESLFTRYVDKLVGVLKQGTKETQDGSKTFDMVRLYIFATFDVMADLTFGESLHMLDKNEWDPWVSTVFGAIKASIQVNVMNVNYPRAAKLINPILSAFFSKMRVSAQRD
jgi:cytochrome P450